MARGAIVTGVSLATRLFAPHGRREVMQYRKLVADPVGCACACAAAGVGAFGGVGLGCEPRRLFHSCGTDKTTSLANWECIHRSHSRGEYLSCAFDWRTWMNKLRETRVGRLLIATIRGGLESQNDE